MEQIERLTDNDASFVVNFGFSADEILDYFNSSRLGMGSVEKLDALENLKKWRERDELDGESIANAVNVWTTAAYALTDGDVDDDWFRNVLAYALADAFKTIMGNLFLSSVNAQVHVKSVLTALYRRRLDDNEQ